MDNGDRPATKQDLLAMEERFEKRFAQLEERLRAHVSETVHETDQRLRAHVSETVHETETKLLRGMFSYAESAQKHFEQLDRADAGQTERTSALERWLLETRKRLEELSRQRPSS